MEDNGMEDESPERRINKMMPVIRHDAMGGYCDGLIVVKVAEEAQLTCALCGAVVGAINPAILAAMFSLSFNSNLIKKAFRRAMTALSALDGQTAVDRAELIPPEPDPAKYLLWRIDTSKEVALLLAAIGWITSYESEQLEDQAEREIAP
jgi:hypothetical protein